MPTALHELHDVSVLFGTVGEARAAWLRVFRTEAPSCSLQVPGLSGLAMRVEQPMPAGELDLRLAGEAFALGEAYIGLKLGLVSQYELRRTVRTFPDTWAEGGRMRQASLLLTDLLALGGHAVVLHAAGAVVKPAPRMRYELGDLRDLETRPWLAWLEVPVSGSETGSVGARTYGLPHYFGAPNVKASAPGADPWSVEAIAQAVRYVAARFATTGEDPFAARTEVRVPLWYISGRRAPEQADKQPARSWQVALDPANSILLSLTSDEVGARHPSRLWLEDRHAPGTMPFETYARAVSDLLAHRFASYGMHLVDFARFDAASLPPVRVLGYESRALSLRVTAGFGRLRAPAGTDELGTAHAELALVGPPNGVDAAAAERVLLQLGSLALGTTAPGGLKDWDHLAPGSSGWGFLLAPLEDIPLAAERPIGLRVLVPITAAEVEALRGGLDRKRFYDDACPSLDALRARWVAMQGAAG